MDAKKILVVAAGIGMATLIIVLAGTLVIVVGTAFGFFASQG